MYEESRMLYDGVYGAQKMEGLRMQDFVRIQERYRAFWNRENETPLLWLCAPRAHTDYSRAPRRPEKTEDRWLDFAYVIRSHRVWMENTYYGGDAYPNFMPNLGPDILGAICGGILRLAKRPAGRARVSRNGKGIRILSLTRTMYGGSGSVP